MFDKFGKAKDLYAMKKKADQLKQELGKISVEVDYKGVSLVMRGDQEVVKVVVDGEEDERLARAFNKAVRKSQKEAAKKMRGRMADFGLPGL